MDSRKIYGWAILFVSLVVCVTGFPNGLAELHQHNPLKESDVVDRRLQTMLESVAEDYRRDDEDNFMMPNMIDTMFGGFGKK